MLFVTLIGIPLAIAVFSLGDLPGGPRRLARRDPRTIP